MTDTPNGFYENDLPGFRQTPYGYFRIREAVTSGHSGASKRRNTDAASVSAGENPAFPAILGSSGQAPESIVDDGSGVLAGTVRGRWL